MDFARSSLFRCAYINGDCVGSLGDEQENISVDITAGGFGAKSVRLGCY